MAQLFCTACGKSNPENAAYCYSCGKQTVLAPASGLSRSSESTSQQRSRNQLPTIEIKPKSKRNGILAGLGCLLFVVGGLYLLNEGDATSIGVGLISIVFGGLGIIAIPRTMRLTSSCILSDEKLTLLSLSGTTSLPWSDVETIGLVKVARGNFNILVGVRLKTYDRYLATITPEMASEIEKLLPAVRVASRAVSLINLPQQELAKLWCAFKGEEEPTEMLKSFGKVKTCAQALLWNREHVGYDLTFSWVRRDRSAQAFAELLEKYRFHASGS